MTLLEMIQLNTAFAAANLVLAVINVVLIIRLRRAVRKLIGGAG